METDATARILVLEDDEFELRLLSELLSERAAVIDAFSSVAPALDAIRSKPYDAVVCDVRLSRYEPLDSNSTRGGYITGLIFARQCQSLQHEIGIVLISGVEMPDVRDWCSRVGADYFSKSRFRSEDFVDRVLRKAHQSRSYRLKTITSFMARFRAFMLAVSNRSDGRIGFLVENEYDVQALLYTSLLLYFNDVRREEVVASTGASSARVDFLLREQRIAIEVKYLRKRISNSDLSTQLIDDSTKYRMIPRCDILVFFIAGDFASPSSHQLIKQDIEKLSDSRLQIVVDLNALRPSDLQ